MFHLRVCVKLYAGCMLCNLFWFSFSFAEYSTILIFVTYNAYQMQIQTDELFAPTRGAFLVIICCVKNIILFIFKKT